MGVTEKDGNGEKHRSKRPEGLQSFLSKLNVTKSCSQSVHTSPGLELRTHQESIHHHSTGAKICTAGCFPFITFIFIASKISELFGNHLPHVFLAPNLLTIVSPLLSTVPATSVGA